MTDVSKRLQDSFINTLCGGTRKMLKDGKNILNKMKKDEYESLLTLDSFIAYLEKTSPDEWASDVVRTKDGKNCVMGHLVNCFYGKDHKKNIMEIWDAFESMWATTFMIYGINDGQSPKWMNHVYNQPTPKERVIAYLKNLNTGKEKTVNELIDEDQNETNKKRSRTRYYRTL